MITMVCDFCGKGLDEVPSTEGAIAGIEVDLCATCSSPIVSDWRKRKTLIARGLARKIEYSDE